MRRIGCLLASILVAVGAWAQSSVPERVLLNVNENMAETAVVTWRTGLREGQAQGQIAVASPDPRFVASAETVNGATQEVRLASGELKFHHVVRFEGLEPGAEYAYRVGDGRTWSEWVHIRTAHREPRPFAFIYFGDAQNDIKSMWSRAIRKAFRELPYADFLLHAGDLVNLPNNDVEWGEWFEAGGWIHASIPSLAAPGNHEYARVNGVRTLSTLWRPHFALPTNGPAGLEATTYYIDYQGARFVSLNSNERIEEQAVWLDKVLGENPHPWSIVTFHHPVFSTARGRDNPGIRAAWQPVFQRHRVALVLQGHDHSYGRKNVPTGLGTVDADGGTVYVVSVSGPKMYRLGEGVERDMTRVAEFTQLYQIVRVSPERIRYEAYTVTGELYDALEIVKNRDGSNRLIPVPVKAPERVEPRTPAATERR